MDRGISTVLDVGLACLLVTASATLLVTTPTPTIEPPDADRIGRAILPSTIAIDSTGHSVETSVGDVLVTAATDGDIAPEVRTAIRERVQSVHPRTSIVTRAEDGTAVRLGPEPGSGVAVDSAVFRIGPVGTAGSANATVGSASTSPGSVVIVVRTWSP